jgi:putative inorganic carbon (HCO3(-)) transporter
MKYGFFIRYRYLPLLSLFLFLVVFPSLSFVPEIGPYNEKRLFQIFLLVISGTVVITSSSLQHSFIKFLHNIPVLAKWGLSAVLGFGILSSALASAPFYSFLELGHFILLFVLAGIVGLAVRQKPNQTEQLILGAIALGVILYTVYFTVGYLTTLLLPALDIGRETIGGFANVRFFNQYQTWTLPLLVGIVASLPQKWRTAQTIAFFLAALWWALVFASNVRGTVLAVFVGAVGVWLLFRSRAYRWLVVQAGAVIAGGGFYFLLFYSGGEATPQVVERFGEVGQSRRTQHWMKCLNMAWTHPWLGVGPMHYAWPPNDFAAAAHPHNAFLQWLAEWGVPSTMIMSSLTVWGGWSWVQEEVRSAQDAAIEANGVRVALVAALLAGTAHAMVSGIIVMPVSQVLLVLIGGWAWGRNQHGSSDSTPEMFSFRVRATLCVVLVASIGIVGTSLHDLTTIEERREAFLEAVDRNRLSPRYWAQGYLNVRDSDVIRQADPNQ